MAERSYGAVSPGIVAELRSICGETGVISGDPARLARYSRDQVAERAYHALPEVVVFPSRTEQVQSILRLAYRERIPVTPRGAGSGLSGGAIPVHGGICLSLERMNRILSIEPDNMVAVVEPGVVTNKLDDALRPHGLFFAGYPMSEDICFIGGNVAENAGGGRAVKYGVTGRYVTGLDVVTASGDLLPLGGKRFKDVTGYDLIGLMVGSEGTLGIFVRITLRLLPRPRVRHASLALFADLQAALSAAARILAGPASPSAVEFMDQLSLQAACLTLKEDLPGERVGGALLLEADGSEEGQVATQVAGMERLCRAGGAFDVRSGTTETDFDRLWRIRKQVPWSLRALSSHQSLEDLVVPLGAVPALVERIRDRARSYGIRIPVYGHAGDGNLHAQPLKNPESTEEQWLELLPRLLGDLYRSAADLGGTLSGEHGVGNKRLPFLPLVMSGLQIDAMRSIKHALDPLAILNPGKIFE